MGFNQINPIPDPKMCRLIQLCSEQELSCISLEDGSLCTARVFNVYECVDQAIIALENNKEKEKEYIYSAESVETTQDMLDLYETVLEDITHLDFPKPCAVIWAVVAHLSKDGMSDASIKYFINDMVGSFLDLWNKKKEG
jgi:hypothetical protein